MSEDGFHLELEKVVPRWSGGDYVYGAFADEDRPPQHIVPLQRGAKLCLGRGHGCEIYVPMLSVARRHCEIGCDEAGAWVRDLHSRNGTYVHRQHIPPDRQVRLRLDDVVRLAGSAFVLTARFQVPPQWQAFQGGLIAHLARGIASERRTGDLPILADALEDAGCPLDELLGHLREEHPLERRCWVVKRLVRSLSANLSPQG
jgi:hypothetical protein